jgi:hypothetical protein
MWRGNGLALALQKAARQIISSKLRRNLTSPPTLSSCGSCATFLGFAARSIRLLIKANGSQNEMHGAGTRFQKCRSENGGQTVKNLIT